MTFVRVPDFGRFGVIQDTVPQALPFGAWSDCRNVRFTGVQLEKMLEPTLEAAWDGTGTPLWLEMWADGLSTYMAIATQTALWFWRASDATNGTWVDASSKVYSEDGQWSSFAWGDTCIFSNGVDAPQIFNPGSLQFEDLPNWGLLSTADDILNNEPPTKQVQAACTMLLPYKGFLVAIGVTESGRYHPNKVWWSDVSNDIGYSGAPLWDYETPATLSGQIEIDPESGAIRTGAQLNESLIIYTDSSATAMSFVGGTFVMSFRRLFNKGAAGLHCVAEFNNQHYVVSQDQLYIHDGSTVENIARERIEEEFFKRAGKGGRFGTGNIDYSKIQVAKNPDRKELYITFDGTGIDGGGIPEYTPIIQAELLYSETSIAPPSYTPEGCIGVNGTKIMANTYENIIYYSDDTGDTWTKMTSFPWPFGIMTYRSNIIVPGPNDGEWYLGLEEPSRREFVIYRTMDNGATWFMLLGDNDYDYRYTSTSILIDFEGRLVFALRKSGELRVLRWDTPSTTSVINTWTTEYNTTFNNLNVDNIKEIEGVGYVISSWDSTTQDIYVVGYDMNSQAFYNTNLTEDDYTPWSLAFKNDYLFAYRSSPGTTGVFDRFENGSSVPLDQITVDFGEDVSYPRMNSAPDYVMMVGSPTAGDSDRWLASYSTTSENGTWVAPIEVQMPTDTDGSKYQHLYWAYGNTWIAYYREGGKTRIVRFNTDAGAISPRTSLVWNFEDNNYSWMDSGVDTGTYIDQTVCMTYGFNPGWQVRWDDLDTEGVTWNNVTEQWSDFYFAGKDQNMYWLTGNGVYRSDQAIKTDGVKDYFVEREGIDLDDVVQQWTSNSYKHIKQFYFHLQSPTSDVGTDPNTFDFTVGWANNLMDAPVWSSPVVVNLQTTTNSGKHKVDFRETGRYLSLRMDFNATQQIAMTGGDMDASEAYGR